MKTLSCLLFIVSALLFSCSKETIAPIESFSADQKMKISLTASRTNVLDAWMLEIELSHGGATSKVFQEFYADEVSKKNVSFQWKSDSMCLILLTQRDGVVISVPVSLVSKQ